MFGDGKAHVFNWCWVRFHISVPNLHRSREKAGVLRIMSNCSSAPAHQNRLQELALLLSWNFGFYAAMAPYSE
jgi:hypothetical protein